MAKRKLKLACPTCKKPVTIEQPEFPFCSERCRTIDLGKWADGQYVVSTPMSEADLMDADSAAEQPEDDKRKERDGRRRG